MNRFKKLVFQSPFHSTLKPTRPTLSSHSKWTPNRFFTSSRVIRTFEPADRSEISKRLEDLPKYNLKSPQNKGDAAVLIPLTYIQKKPAILFTLRSDKVGTHKRQVSFPGGKQDEEDKSIIETALRETEEELNMRELRRQIEILGTFRQAMSITNYVVTPVVGFVDDLENQIEKRRVSPEIEEVFSVSLEDLSNPKAIEWEDLNRGRLPYFTSGKHRIWGLTA
jgi:8-oxo-dGTP pyrophosphatase MutT (NUDIX family)